MLSYQKVKLKEKDNYLRNENNLFASVWATPYYIGAEIHWGDWKHEHLRCKWLAKEFFSKLGIWDAVETEVTEEDGSDCYSAVHRFYVDLRKELEV